MKGKIAVGIGTVERAREPVGMDVGLPVATRPPGRPRSAAADRTILNATLEVLALVGFGRLTVEGVAAHAGVGKATIYRRWPSKMALVLAAVDELSSAPRPEPGTGSVRSDLVVALRQAIELLTTTIVGRILPGLIAETSRSPELVAALRNLWVSRRESMVEILASGAANGELPADTDCELVADLLYGPVHYRFLFSAAPLDVHFAEHLVANVLPPLSPSSSAASRLTSVAPVVPSPAFGSLPAAAPAGAEALGQ